MSARQGRTYTQRTDRSVLLLLRDAVEEERSQQAVHLLLEEEQVAAVVVLEDVVGGVGDAEVAHLAQPPTTLRLPNDPKRKPSSISTSTWTKRFVSNLPVDEKVRLRS